MINQTQISCPNCNEQIDVNDILKHQIEDSIRKEFLAKEAASKKSMEEKEAKLADEKALFEAQKKKQAEEFQNLLNSKIEKELK